MLVLIDICRAKTSPGYIEIAHDKYIFIKGCQFFDGFFEVRHELIRRIVLAIYYTTDNVFVICKRNESQMTTLKATFDPFVGTLITTNMASYASP